MEKIWKKYFNINKTLKGYVFNNLIYTNLKSVSISLIKAEQYEKKRLESKIKAKNALKKKKIFKGKSQIIINKLKEEEKQEKIKKKKKTLEKNKLKKKEGKEKFAKLPEEEKKKIKIEMKIKKNNGIMYIEDAINDKELCGYLSKAYKDKKIVVRDDGKIENVSLGYKKCNDENNKTYKEETLKIKDETTNKSIKIKTGRVIYVERSKRMLKETKRLKNNELIERTKNNLEYNEKSIKNRESELCKYSTKSVDVKIFNEYVKLKLKLIDDIKTDKFKMKGNEKIKQEEIQKKKQRNKKRKIKYKDRRKKRNGKRKIKKNNEKRKNKGNFEEQKVPIKDNKYDEVLKKIEWYQYINRNRYEDKTISDIKKIYGKDAIFVIGDGSKKGHSNYIPIANGRFFKLLCKHFTVYLMDEFRTTILYWRTNEECKNLYVKTSEGKYIKKHLVLMCETENGSKECINRNLNAGRNMYRILDSLMNTKKRPINFTREIKKENIKRIDRISNEMMLETINKLNTKKEKVFNKLIIKFD